MSASKCLYCEKRLKLAPKYVRERGRAQTVGLPPKYGYEGNNAFCSSRCGYLTACALLRADPDVTQLLPPKWNHAHVRSV